MSTTAIHRNALATGTMLLEYKLEAVLGVGGFGMTYLARDINLDKPVAIKEYFPSSVAMRALDGSVVSSDATATHDYQWGLERFLQEARTLARFSHPHIVRVNRYFEANSTGYMVMDYEDGESLHQALKKEPSPADARVKALLLPLLDGLQSVHGAGFLHRDIKPANIFIRRNGTPVLIDFGSARQAMGDSTKTLTAVLTPGYAPLEQYSGAGDQGPWTDIYALGGVLYRVYTGDNPPDAVSRIKNDVVPEKLAALRGRVSAPMLGALEWALTLDEQSRPQTVDAWRKAIEGKSAAALTTHATKATGAGALTALNAITRPLATAAAAPVAASTAATRREPITNRPAVRVNYDKDGDESTSKWRWIAIGAVVLFVGGIAYTSHSRKEARLAAEKAEAQKQAEDIRLAQLQAAQQLAAQLPAREVPPRPVADTSTLDQREAALREKEQRAADREAALRKLEEERTRERERATTAAPSPAPKAATPAAEPARPVPTPEPPRAAPSADLSNADPITQKITADFRAHDSNGDGYLTPDEIRGRMPGLERNFSSVDTNGDGRVSLEELLAARPFRGPPDGGPGGFAGAPGGTPGSPQSGGPALGGIQPKGGGRFGK